MTPKAMVGRDEDASNSISSARTSGDCHRLLRLTEGVILYPSGST